MEQLAVTPQQFDEIVDLSGFASNGIAYSLDGCRAFFVKIGPELAKKIVATYSTDYRKLRVRHMESLAVDMKMNHWQLDGSPIRMNQDNELADGQHRLYAIIKSETAQEFLVVDKLPPESYNTMDTNHLTRSYIDILRRRGYTNCSHRASLAKMVWYWDNRNTLDFKQGLSVARLDEVHEKPEYRDRFSWAIVNSSNVDRKIHVRKSVLGLAFFVLGQISETAIKELIHAVAIKEGLYRGTPSYALMNRLSNDHNNEREKLRTNDETMWIITRAWKTYYQNMSRPDNDQLTLGTTIFLPSNGVTVNNIKELLVSS